MVKSRIMYGLAALICTATIGLAQKPPSAEENREANFKAYVDLLRKDVKKEKVAILSELMDLGPEEAAKFWPVYNEYDRELMRLADERIAFLRMYAENFDALTDANATQIVDGLIGVDSRRNQLVKKYFDKLSQTLTPKLAGRFVQIEHQLLLLIDLQISASLPVVE